MRPDFCNQIYNPDNDTNLDKFIEKCEAQAEDWERQYLPRPGQYPCRQGDNSSASETIPDRQLIGSIGQPRRSNVLDESDATSVEM